MTRGFLYQLGPSDEVRQFVIQQDRIVIGRRADCDIQLRDATVSRHHAVITVGVDCRIADLGGMNVTTVNGAPLEGRSRGCCRTATSSW